MTITLEVTPEAKESLAAQAEAQGLSLDAFLQAILATQAAAVASAVPAQPVAVAPEEAEKIIDELFDLAAIPPEAGEGAASRRNWYR